MKCQHCGAGNPDAAKFCRKCGKLITYAEPKAAPPAPATGMVHRDTLCPYCGGENCQPMMRNITKIKSTGYGWGSGCCGMLLMGPFGLLCGLCGMGSKVDSRNETVWICKNCGKEHLSQKSALDRAQINVEGYAMSIFVVALLLSVWYYHGGLPLLVPFAWAFSPIVAWSMVNDELSKELGYPLREVLSPDVSVPGYLLIAEAATILTLLFGGAIVIRFLSNL